MPQLWIETFVTQYFWLLLILFSFYYFITTQVIPNISETIKARQISDNKDIKIEEVANEKAINLFNNSSKSNLKTDLVITNWDSVQNDWLSTSPELDASFITDIQLSEETRLLLNEIEENEITLEEFLNSEQA